MNQLGVNCQGARVRGVARLALVLGVMVGAVGAQQWLEGKVFDAKGRPVAGVEIRMQPRSWSGSTLKPPGASSKAVARTNAQGAYRLEHRSAYWYFSKPGLAATMTLDPQGMVVMIPARDVTGKVTDEAGKPIAGVQLGSYLQYGDPHAVHGKPLAMTKTEEDGTFVLRGVPMQGVTLEARKGGYYAHRKPLTTDGKVELRLAKSGFVRGRIVDAQGQGLEGRILVRSEMARYSVLGYARELKSRRDGSFSVPLHLRGRYRLVILAPGHTNLESPVFDREQDLGPLAMIAARLLSVRVVDSEGQPLLVARAGGCFAPLGGACPYLGWEGYILANQKVVDESGWARLTVNHYPSMWNQRKRVGYVGAWATGFGARRLDVPLDPTLKALAPLTIELAPELTLEGVVVDLAGKPVAGVQVDHAFAEHFRNGANWAVSLQDGRRRAPRIPRTDPTGRFRIPGLSAGKYMLVTTHRWRPAGGVMAVTIGPGQGKERGVDDKGASIKLLSYSGARVQGRLLGQLMPGCVRVGGSLGDLNLTRHPLVPLHKDGRFVAAGLATQMQGGPRPKWFSHKVQLILPRPQPCQMIPLVVGEVVCKESTTSKEWRLAALGLASVQGFVLQDVVPRHRLLIQMRMRGTHHQVQFSSVEEDGSFRLESPPGTFTLRVLDWVTGVELHREDLIELAANKIARPRIKIHPRVVDVQLGPAKPGVKVPSVHLRAEPGYYLDVHRDLDWGEKLRLYLPAAPYTLSAHLNPISLFRMQAMPRPPGLRVRLRQPLGTVLIPGNLGTRPGTVPLVTLPVHAVHVIPD